jgi:hypothetical protein
MEEALMEAATPVTEQTAAQEIDAANREPQDAVQIEGQEAAQEVKPETPKEEAVPKGVQKRIDRAVRQKYEAEARANELERRIRELETKTTPREAQAGEPRIEQFESIEDYVSAKAAFVADQRIQHTLSTHERANAEQRAQAAQHQSAENWNKRVILATAEMPDFEDVVESSDISFRDPVVLEAIKESDIGPKIAYYLAMNPDEAATIAGLSGVSAIRAIGRLEAKILDGKATVTKTPPPIEPAGTKAKAVKTPDQMSDNEFAEWRKRHIKAR